MKAKAVLGLSAVTAAVAFFLAALEQVAAAGVLGLVCILLLYGSDLAVTKEHNENIN